MLPAMNETCGNRVLAMLIASSERSIPVTWPKAASLSLYQPGPQPTSRMRGRPTATDLTKLNTFSCRLCFHSLTVLRSCQCCQCQSQKLFCSEIVGCVDDILVSPFLSGFIEKSPTGPRARVSWPFENGVPQKA